MLRVRGHEGQLLARRVGRVRPAGPLLHRLHARPGRLAPDVVHWMAHPVRFGTHMRQRCAWCGAALIDVDLATIAMPSDQAAQVDPDDPFAGYGKWPVGALVAVAGGTKWVLAEPADDQPTPPQACMRLDPEVTK